MSDKKCFACSCPDLEWKEDSTAVTTCSLDRFPSEDVNQPKPKISVKHDLLECVAENLEELADVGYQDMTGEFLEVHSTTHNYLSDSIPNDVCNLVCYLISTQKVSPVDPTCRLNEIDPPNVTALVDRFRDVVDPIGTNSEIYDVEDIVNYLHDVADCLQKVTHVEYDPDTRRLKRAEVHVTSERMLCTMNETLLAALNEKE